MSVLELLLEAYPNHVSGEEMATKLGISRTSVWKHIRALEQCGMRIEARQNNGYRLLTLPDILRSEIIARHLQTKELGRNLLHRTVVDSTNNLAKELAKRGAVHGTIVTAEQQTAGRGRRGRAWISPQGEGIFCTIILRPHIPARRAPLLTLAAGVAVVEALREKGLVGAWLKWPNDVWVGKRKLAGILCELTGELEEVEYVLVGVGVNVHQLDFPSEIREHATSCREESGEHIDRADLLASILLKLESLLPLVACHDITPLLQAWERYDLLKGEQVQVITTAGSFTGIASGLNDEGSLIVQLASGERRVVLAGDVSLRPAT